MPTIKRQVQYGLLFLSWVAWFYIVTFLTQLILTPWDGAIDWPAIGTWPRALNDFFAGDPGRLIISIPLILINIVLTHSILRRYSHYITRVVGLSWLFIPALILICYGAMMLNNLVYPYPPVLYAPDYRGFYRSVIPAMALIGLCVFWLFYWPKALFIRPFPNR